MADIADVLVWHVFSQEPTLGGSRLLCVDGRAGAGKTTLAEAIAVAAVELGSVRLVHMDDVYQGWNGLDIGMAQVAGELVAPLKQDRPGRYRRYDWNAGTLAEWHTVNPVDLLVVEGVGSGSAAYADQITALLWLEAPRALRLERGRARDGEAVLPHWLVWMDEEDSMFVRERTRQRADVVVDGTGESDRAIVFV